MQSENDIKTILEIIYGTSEDKRATKKHVFRMN